MIARIEVPLESIQAAMTSLNGARETILGAMAMALYQQAELVMTRSKAEFVPVDTGALRASGHVTPPTVQGSRAEVVLGFGGAAVTYAVIVHEDLSARHRVGRAKYLELPLLEATTQIHDAVTAAAREVMTRAPR